MEALIYKGLEGVGFTETNPDKGTETIVYLDKNDSETKDKLFTETNPDKGTETLARRSIRGVLSVYRN